MLAINVLSTIPWTPRFKKTTRAQLSATEKRVVIIVKTTNNFAFSSN